VVVVAPATAVAGAATTTPANRPGGRAPFLFRAGVFRSEKHTDGIFSLFSGTGTHVRSV